MSDFIMSLDLNILNHLGLNLYSNVPSVLSEIVANSWDADATTVDIDWDSSLGTIVVTDNGVGMTPDEVNNKYLSVGYAKRKNGETVTHKLKRKVMGRKGIGKLSVFSIANKVKLYTVRDGIKSALMMDIDDIKKSINDGESAYHPKVIDFDCEIDTGTKIILSSLKKSMSQSQRTGLRKRIARRFTVIGCEKQFEVRVDGKILTTEDREYYHKIQYCYLYKDSDGATISEDLPANASTKIRANTFGSYSVSGWIATAEQSNALNVDGNINKIVLIVRGKVAQEDILASYNIGSMYAKYVFGEIHADFLDDDDLEDIATSSRQHIVEDDERYVKLSDFIKKELDALKKDWEVLRADLGTQKALEYVSIKKWYNSLDPKHQPKARQLFGKINQIQNDVEDRKTLLRHAILAFETMKHRDQLNLIDSISTENVDTIVEIFKDYDSIEASMYFQIAKGRIDIIKQLEEKVDANELEKVLQKFIFEHLWLLDPAWERATGVTPHMEKNVSNMFKTVTPKLTDEEKSGRVDIKYTTTAGKHVIIELKRASVRTDTNTLIHQMKKYKSGLAKIIRDTGEQDPYIECIFVVGEDLTDWSQEDGKSESEKQFTSVNMRLLKYGTLLNNAQKAYSEYINASKKISAIQTVLDELEKELK